MDLVTPTTTYVLVHTGLKLIPANIFSFPCACLTRWRMLRDNNIPAKMLFKRTGTVAKTPRSGNRRIPSSWPYVKVLCNLKIDPSARIVQGIAERCAVGLFNRYYGFTFVRALNAFFDHVWD